MIRNNEVMYEVKKSMVSMTRNGMVWTNGVKVARNGMVWTNGVKVDGFKGCSFISLFPINSRGNLSNGYIQVPVGSIPELIKVLKKIIK